MESCTNPLMMGVDAAARTKQIRIGQACNVITFHNPIRLAEDIALLDQLSNGRVEVGIGRGIYGREAINMNKEADLKDQAKNFRLFEETLTIMKKAWTEKFFSHKGEFYTYPSPNFVWQHDMSPPSEEFLDTETNEIKKISVVPKPKQNPHPPIWQVVDGARSIEWAAQNGLNTIMWIPTVKALKKRFEIYQEAKSKAENRDVALGEGVSLVRDMFVAETMEEAEKMAEGIGIDALETKQVFNRFYRTAKARAESNQGSGLGLAITKHLVNQLHGEVGVVSNQDVGSTFWFTLPLDKKSFS